MNWFTAITVATVLYGIMNYLYKLAASRGCPTALVVNRSASTVALLSLAVLCLTGSSFERFPLIAFFALINSSFFCLGSLSKLQALKRLPASVAFPVSKLNAVFVILASLVLFDDRIEAHQWAGVGLSLAMLMVASVDVRRGGGSAAGSRKTVSGLFWALTAAAGTAVSMLTGKFASTRVPLFNYIFVSYSLVAVYTYAMGRFGKGHLAARSEARRNATVFGLAIGTLNLAGYYLVLTAFSLGPLALIQGVFSTSFLIPITLSVLALKEPFDRRKAGIVVLTLLSLLLIKIRL